MRVTAENLNRLLGLAGESIVASRWVDTFATELLRLKRLQNLVVRAIDNLRQSTSELELDERVQSQLLDAQNRAADCRDHLASRLDEIERRLAALEAR